MNQATDVVVVGGGLAGLAAAAYLGRAGRRVTVIEKASALGGRAATQEKGGFLLNLGPHALYLGGAARRGLDALGVAAPGGLPPTSGGLAVRDGHLHTLPTGLLSLLTTDLLDLSARLELARFLAGVQRIDPAPLAGVTTTAWLGRTLRSPGARGVLDLLVRVSTYSADFERLSAEVAVRQLQLAIKDNVRYLDGGWRVLVDGLRRVAAAAGARVVTDAKAERVELEGGAVTGVVLADGTRLDARAVILAVSPAAAAALVPGDASLAAYASRAVPVRAACLDLALSRLPRRDALVAFGVDCPLYLSVHSASAKLGPPGSALVHLAKYLGGPGGDGDPEAELEALMDLVHPGFRDVLLQRRFLPSLVVSNALVTAVDGGLAGRPAAAVPGVRGLSIAGDWVGDEGMLADASIASAERAAEVVLAGAADGAAVKRAA
jgi:phytoene dehydrogenase-like protein